MWRMEYDFFACGLGMRAWACVGDVTEGLQLCVAAGSGGAEIVALIDDDKLKALFVL